MEIPEAIDVYCSQGPPIQDLAREACLLDGAAESRCSVFFFSWERPVVILGYGQPTEDVDLAWCRYAGVPVLRRLTGGTGVVHRGDLGVTLALPQSHPWAQDIVGLYGRFLDVLLPSLRDVGSKVVRLEDPPAAGRTRSPICFLDQLSDTLVVGGRKAVGCAQTRRRGGVLIHAAILLGLDTALYSRVFRVSEEQVGDGLAPALEGGSWSEVGNQVVKGLAHALDFVPHDRLPSPVPDRYVEPYTTPHWAPVSD